MAISSALPLKTRGGPDRHQVSARTRLTPGGTIYYSPASVARGFDTLTLWPVAPALNNVQPASVDVSWSPPDWQSASPIHDYDLEVLVDGVWAN